MAGIHEFSARLVDYAHRLDAIADAAAGKHPKGGRMTRWLMLPASGAALYAFVRGDLFSRQAKGLLSEAKSVASDLPDDLMAVVRQSAETVKDAVPDSDGSQQSRRSNPGRPSARRQTTTRKRTPRRKSTPR